LGDGQQPGSVMPVFNLTLRHFFTAFKHPN